MRLAEQYLLLADQYAMEEVAGMTAPHREPEASYIEDVHRIEEPFTVMLWRTLPGAKVVYTYIDKDRVATKQDAWHRPETYLHRHGFIEMLYVVKGELNQIICGEKQTFTEGMACIIDTNCEHTDIVADQDNFVVFLCMNESFFDQLFLTGINGSSLQQFLINALMSQKSQKQFIRFRPKDVVNTVYDLVEQVVTEKETHQIGSDYIIKGLMIRIFDTLIRKYDTDLTQMQRKRMNELLFHEVELYLATHYSDVTIEDLVNVFHFQKDYFNRLVRRHTGLTYSGFLQKMRLQKAEEMLLGTKMPVKKIIQAVGYENAHYFYKVFEKAYGLTPGAYRQSQVH